MSKVVVSWNANKSRVYLNYSIRMKLCREQTEKLCDALLQALEDMDQFDKTDMDRPDALEAQLTSEVEAAMNQGPAAPPSSPAPICGSARMAEELGSARHTLSDILDSSPLAPQEDQTNAQPTPRTIRRASDQRPDYEILLTGLAAHPTDPGKILINGLQVSIGHARNYAINLTEFIKQQADRAFVARMGALVQTTNPLSEIPALRCD